MTVFPPVFFSLSFELTAFPVFKFLPSEIFIQLNACPMKFGVNFIGATPIQPGRSGFNRGTLNLEHSKLDISTD
jgi:hypothetical protein